jgi:uncharacterized RmlC-like cupin family protein
MTADVRRITPGERTQGASTPGMTREQAIATDRTWSGLVFAQPGTVSGWHHHGEYETTIYVLSGKLRMESGPRGVDVMDAGAGDFVYVARGAVHRESNPSDEAARLVVVRAGSGDPVVNVEGPAPR